MRGGVLVWIILVYKISYIANIFQLEKLKKLYQFLKNNFKPKTNTRYTILLLFLLFVPSIILFKNSVKHTIEKFQIKEYISSQSSLNKKDFFKENYRVPEVNQITFNKKKNLVIVLVESLEFSFSDPAIGTSLIPNLNKLKKLGQYNTQMHQVRGTTWTIAALTAWHFGIPLKLPSFIGGNKYDASRQSSFLPNALSIFDVLEKNGYKQTLIMGSDKFFSGMNNLNKHGNFRILDKKYWIKTGLDLKKNGGTGWGFNDKLVLEQSIEEYKKLYQEKKPFVLLIQTIDTHAPNGFCPEEKKKFFDIRDAIIEADKNVSEFAKAILKENHKDTVLVILGDHNFMGSPNFLFPVLEKRTLFNLFLGEIPSFSKEKKLAYISSLDIAPTLLELAGAKWNHQQFGLGISLFSDEPSLLEKYGLEQLNDNLMQRSDYYNKFY